MSKITIQTLREKKNTGKKMTMLTAYEVNFARYIDGAGIDVVLVGDSLGNVFAGHPNTIPVTLDEIIYHCKAVRRGTQHALLLADMPFMSYHLTAEQAKENAGRLIKEAGAEAVKLEVLLGNPSYIEDLTHIGIPVMAHIGFTPQSVHQLGGYKVQGRDHEAEYIEFAKRLEAAGAFALLLEMVPADLTEAITKAVSIPTFGIGAGPHADGQVLVTQDLLGIGTFKPKFVKHYARLSEEIQDALKAFKSEVESGEFPSLDQSY